MTKLKPTATAVEIDKHEAEKRGHFIIWKNGEPHYLIPLIVKTKDEILKEIGIK